MEASNAQSEIQIYEKQKDVDYVKETAKKEKLENELKDAEEKKKALI